MHKLIKWPSKVEVKGFFSLFHTLNTVWELSHPLLHPRAGPCTPLHSDMAGCWQINSSLANIGPKKFHLTFESVPDLVKYINTSIVFYSFITFFIILEIKVALISYSLSKATSKDAENNGVMVW